MTTNYHGWDVLYDKTLQSVKEVENELILTFNCGSTLTLYHIQDCCESVYIEECPSFTPYYGKTLSSIDVDIEVSECFTLTVFTFYWGSASPESCEVRWLGTSNGYYDENVDYKVKLSANWEDLYGKTLLSMDRIKDGELTFTFSDKSIVHFLYEDIRLIVQQGDKYIIIVQQGDKYIKDHTALIGKILLEVSKAKDGNKITFKFSDEYIAKMYCDKLETKHTRK